MTRILVTGGAGFIGSHVVDALCRDGHPVTVLDDLSGGRRENLADAVRRGGDVTMHEVDILSPQAASLVAAARPEVMVLLAAQMSVAVSMRDPVLDARVNVEGLLRMLEAARACGCRKVVFASSGGTIYGAAAADGPGLAEDHPRIPTSFYGLTKSAAVDYLRLYRDVHGLDFAALALGNVYGPRQDPRGEAGVIAIFAGRMLAGQPCVINGDGLTTRDYVHVTDVANAFTRATIRGHGLINVGTGQGRSVREIHAALASHTGDPTPPRYGAPLPGEVRHVRLDIRRAATELGWHPVTGLDQGLGTVVTWLRRRQLISATPRH